MEPAALANLRRYQSLFDNAIEGVFQMSLGRRFVTANPAMARLMGYTSSRELLDLDPDVLETCFADERVRRWVIGQLESRGTVKGIEARYYTRSGEERWATISLHTVYTPDGDPAHLEAPALTPPSAISASVSSGRGSRNVWKKNWPAIRPKQKASSWPT